MTFRYTYKNNAQGFNLIEAAIVIGVIGLVIGGVWVAASAVSENLRVSKTLGDFQLIVRNSQQLYSIQTATQITTEAGGNVDITSALRSAGAYPADWIANATSIRHPFGGTARAILYSNAINYYFDDLPPSICRKIMVRVSSVGRGQGSAL